MRRGNAPGLARLAVVTALLLAMSAPAEAGGFRDWLRKFLGSRFKYVERLMSAHARYGEGTAPQATSPIDTGQLMVLNLRTIAASPLPGAPAASWSPVAISSTKIAFLSGSGQYADQHDAGLWVYSRESQQAELVISPPAGASFYAIAGRAEEEPHPLVVVLRSTDGTPRTLYRVADLSARTLDSTPDGEDEDGDPRYSGRTRVLLLGSRIQEGIGVEAVAMGPATQPGPRDIVLRPVPLGGLGPVDYRLIVRDERTDRTDNFDPSWLSDTEIIYVAKPWPGPPG